MSLNAMKLLQNKKFDLPSAKSELMNTSKNTVIKITNLLTQADIINFSESDWQDLENEVVDEFKRYGTINNVFLVRSH